MDNQKKSSGFKCAQCRMGWHDMCRKGACTCSHPKYQS